MDLPPLLAERIAFLAATSHPLTLSALRRAGSYRPSPTELAALVGSADESLPLFLSIFNRIARSTASAGHIGCVRRFALVDTDFYVDDDTAYRRTNVPPCVAIQKVSFHIIGLLNHAMVHNVLSIRFRVFTVGTAMVVTYHSKIDMDAMPGAYADIHISPG